MIFWHIIAIAAVFILGYFFGRWTLKHYYEVKYEELKQMYKHKKRDMECPARMQ
jgi:Tfp pilus assembly protein PilO